MQWSKNKFSRLHWLFSLSGICPFNTPTMGEEIVESYVNSGNIFTIFFVLCKMHIVTNIQDYLARGIIFHIYAKNIICLSSYETNFSYCHRTGKSPRTLPPKKHSRSTRLWQQNLHFPLSSSVIWWHDTTMKLQNISILHIVNIFPLSVLATKRTTCKWSARVQQTANEATLQPASPHAGRECSLQRAMLDPHERNPYLCVRWNRKRWYLFARRSCGTGRSSRSIR